MSVNAGNSIIEFLKLGRPKFLLGGCLFYGLGAALAAVEGAPMNWRRYAWGQLIVSCTQLMTHYSNDYFDLAADRANTTPTRWSGGSRVLVNGSVPPRAALIAAVLLAAAAFGATAKLNAQLHHAPDLMPLVLTMLVLSWCYSAPPVRLLSRGWGEFTTAVVVTLITPLLGFYLQSGVLRPLPLLAAVPLCGLQFAMLLAIELPDAAGDAAQGKRTLVVRKGADWGARACAGLVASSFCSLPLLVFSGLPWLIAVMACLPAPLAVWHARRLIRGAYRDPAQWESIALSSVALLASTGLGELAGSLLILSGRG